MVRVYISVVTYIGLNNICRNKHLGQVQTQSLLSSGNANFHHVLHHEPFIYLGGKSEFIRVKRQLIRNCVGSLCIVDRSLYSLISILSAVQSLNFDGPKKQEMSFGREYFISRAGVTPHRQFNCCSEIVICGRIQRALAIFP